MTLAARLLRRDDEVLVAHDLRDGHSREFVSGSRGRSLRHERCTLSFLLAVAEATIELDLKEYSSVFYECPTPPGEG